MTAKKLMLPLVLGALVISAGLLVYQIYGSPPPVAEAPEPPPPAGESAAPPPTPVAEVALELAPAPRTPAETPAKSTWRPGLPFENSTPAPKAKPKKSAAGPDKPSIKTASGATPVLKTWPVPPLDLPKDRMYLQLTPSVAVNNEGTRVIVQNHPGVDFWDAAKGKHVRVLPEQGAQLSGAIVAQDASRAYVRNDKTNKLETYDGTGTMIGNLPAIGFVGFGLRRAGYDFSPRDYVLATKSYDVFKSGKGRTASTETGIFEFDPANGETRLAAPIKDTWDTHDVQRLLRRPGGDFLAYYNTTRAGKKLRGLFTISKDGTFANVANLPSKDMAYVSDLTISPDGRYLAFLGANRLELWDLPAKKLLLDWREEYRFPDRVRFTGDGRLAIVSGGTTIQEVATSNLSPGPIANTTRIDVLKVPSLRFAGQLTLADFNLPDQAFAFSPNGKRMVLADKYQVALIDADAAFPNK